MHVQEGCGHRSGQCTALRMTLARRRIDLSRSAIVDTATTKPMNRCTRNHSCTSGNNARDLFSTNVECISFRYKKINNQTPVLKKWVEKLVSEGTIKRDWYDVCIETQSMFIGRSTIFSNRPKKRNTRRFSMMPSPTRRAQPTPKTRIGLIHHGKVSETDWKGSLLSSFVGRFLHWKRSISLPENGYYRRNIGHHRCESPWITWGFHSSSWFETCFRKPR